MEWNLLLALICAFGLSYFLIPIIIKVALSNHLVDEPGGRKQHKKAVPPLGGVAIYCGVWTGIAICTDLLTITTMKYFYIATLLLLIVGVRDDIYGMKAIMKLIYQIIVANIIYFAGFKLAFIDFYFGDGFLSIFMNYGITIGWIVLLINALNLIDGIDGLAGSIGTFAAITLGFLFWHADAIQWSIVAFSLAAALIAFLRFNIHQAQIFMGDTGAMFLGLIIGVLSIQYLNSSWTVQHVGYSLLNVAIIVLIPVIDLVRVFITRMLNGKSPFEADRTHIHHILIDTGLNTWCICSFLILLNAIYLAILPQLEADILIFGIVLMILSVWQAESWAKQFLKLRNIYLLQQYIFKS